MKNKIQILIVLLIFSTINLMAQSKLQPQAPSPKMDQDGDMKTYVMVFLKAGPNRKQSKEEAAKIQEGHLNHLRQMAEEGFLVSAGPFLDEGDIKGILIFNVDNADQIKDQVNQDPAIIAGRLIPEYHKWLTKAGTTLPK